jgi:hypothetical protein
MLRDRRVFRWTAYTLAALTLLGFALRVVQKALDGHWLETYRSARLIPWSYGSAFVMLIFVTLAALVAEIIRLVHWLRYRER